MFKSKSHGDIKRLAKKFVDLKKTNADRFKYLKILVGIGNNDGDRFAVDDVKLFFEQHYQHVYFVFYDTFSYVEQERRNKGQRVHKDDFECLLVLFEKILVLLPHLIQRRWQFHSIRRLLKQMLHSGNTLKLRKDGIRLFVIWYQILQRDNDEQNHEIFSKLVTLFEDTESYLTFSQTASVPTSEIPVAPVDIFPLMPATSTDKNSSKPHKFLMESVLTFMVSEVVKIQWNDPSMQEVAFRFLFASFKTYYLNVIFPNFDNKTSVYSASIDHLPDFGIDRQTASVDVLEDCQDVVIRWFTTFVQATRSNIPTEPNKEESHNTEVSDIEPEGGTLKEGDMSTMDSKAGTLTNGSVDRSLVSSGVEDLNVEDGHMNLNQHDIVYKVLLGDRNNIDIVHEIFRQAFMLPLTHAGAVRRVVLVYKDWLQVPDTRPVFMQEPTGDQASTFDEVASTDTTKDLGSKGSDSRPRDPDEEMMSPGSHQEEVVRAGLQNSLLLFIKHSAFVFMINPSNDSLSMQDQDFSVDLCRRVLNIYRYMVMNIDLDNKTWEQLLVVLLKVTSYVLGQEDALLGRHLAASLFQTLIVSWIKANLCIHMPETLWDQLLLVLSSLCQWEELVKEWAKTMETLTRVLAKQVYKLNLSDLPLDRLSEQKSKRQRGKMRGEAVIPQRGRSFTEAIHSFPTQITRSSSDSNLSGSMDKLKIGSTGTLVYTDIDHVDQTDGDTLKSSNQDTVVRNGVDSSSADDHIPMSINDETSPENNLTRHSSFKSDTVEERKSSPRDETPMEDNTDDCSHHSSEQSAEIISPLTRKQGSLHLRPPRNGSLRNGTRLSSEGTSSIVSESEASEDTNSMLSLSEYSEALRTPTPSEGPRSRSSSPTSTDLSQYLPDDMASFLKQDSMSLRHAASLDKDSITIEEIERTKGDSVSDYRSVLTGGQIPGWTPDVAVVLWRRMLGALGDINDIKQTSVHERVMGHLLELQDTLLKLSDNRNVSADNTYSQEPAEITPPVFYFFPVCFKCMSLGPEYMRSKIIAVQMLTKICLRHDYLKVPDSHLARFYQLLHKMLISTEQQPLVDTLVRHCAPLLFGLDLPGCNLFIMDVLNAAISVLSLEAIRLVPRREAITLLGTLVCFPNHFGAIDVLTQGNCSRNEMEPDQLKELVLGVLLDAGRKEPAGLARCVALSSLGIFLVEEILSGERHPKFREAVNVLLVSLRFNTRLVAWVACDMLQLLSNFVTQLKDFEAGLPLKIVSTIVATLHNHVFTPSTLDDNLVISIMLCLLRWCMNLPLCDLVKKDEQGVCLIGKVLKILQAVSGGMDKSMPGANQGFTQEYDLESMMSVAACTNSPIRALRRGESMEPADSKDNNITCAAKFVMRHLVNLISHFPGNSNPTRTFTSLQECHDLDISTAEMTKEIFDSPNLQMFVFNKSTLITVMEIQKQDVSCAMKSTAIPSTSARVLVRDLTGKYSASGTMVYERQPAPTTFERSRLITADRSISQTSITDDPAEYGSIASTMNSPLKLSKDPLDKILRHIGELSPECQLQPGEQLDVPVASVEEEVISDEEQVKVTSANHEQEELAAHVDQKTDFRLQVGRAWITQYTPSTFPYTVCRQLLNQLGYLLWDTRQKYHLLNKSDKLLREIKHLDSQSCRETHKFAVVYVSYGQEDKQSILSNSSGSPAFERFLSSLGWEVDLATHEGFLGGLQRNGTNGVTAPYYCDSTLESMFHVSTRMPADTEDDRHRKLRHIGNDEVHVVWSEHYRPYRRGIIPTEFGDVIIVIYPLKSGLFRIQIDKKGEVPYVGPLFDGAIVSERVLPILVRCTAINASRVHRLTIPLFKPFYQVRVDSLDKIARDCKMDTTFETYTAGVFAPALSDQDYVPPNLNEGTESEQPSDVDNTDSAKNKDISRKPWQFFT